MTRPTRTLDTFTRLGGKKELKTRQEGIAFFLSEAHELIPRYARVHSAWTVMLVRQGILDTERGAKILGALRDVGPHTIDEMVATYDPRFPKTILQFERYLTDKIGPIASDVIIGRTLPPPHYRMKMREAILPLLDAVLAFQKTLLEYSDLHREVVMPGYTHYMHAQPMTFGHYLLGLHEAVAEAEAQLEASYASVNRCDLGCGALAGTSFPIDRELPARLLGFDSVLEHANFCVAGTDQAVTLVCALTNLMLPMGRAATEMYHWCTFEYNMLEVDASISETSSMMPQKRNPCVFEEIRQTVGAVMGAYNDACARSHNIMWGDTIEVMQLSEATVPVVEKVLYAVNLFNKTVPAISVHREVMLKHAAEGFSTCTELAAILVREKKIPWRICHAIVAEVVRELSDSGRTARDMTPELVDEMARRVTGEPLGLDAARIGAALDPVKFVAAHRSRGGVAPEEVGRMVAERKRRLAEALERQKERYHRLAQAESDLDAAVREIAGA
ncbi:argininosuccinate lyase [bacterium]|nr:argininosuccinate lyase [bacterium]